MRPLYTRAPVPGEPPVQLHGHAQSLHGRSSVREDWRAWLPEDKSSVFQTFAEEFETSYRIVSVSLDEAISLRDQGLLDKSRLAAAITAEVSRLLIEPLLALLRALGSHSRNYGTAPNSSPLDPANYRGTRCLRAARLNTLLSRVLLTQRSQFLYKIHTLLEMVEDIQKDLGASLADVVDGTSVCPKELWHELDALHFDLNTCLRETVVLLKSFLHALPNEEIPDFEREARRMPSREPDHALRPGDVPHRRPVIIASK